jgi:hypothetical protein
MIPFRPLYGQAQVYSILFASFALAALQNVTVDDAVSTGAVVPQYLPNESVWNQGNTCTGCYVQPNPSLAYNGTWHDTTFSSSNGYTQEIEFSFTGASPVFQDQVALMNILHGRKCPVHIFHHRKQRSKCHYVHGCRLRAGPSPEHIHTQPINIHRVSVQRTRLCQRFIGFRRAQYDNTACHQCREQCVDFI